MTCFIRGKLGKKTDGKVRRTTSLGKPTDGSSDESSDDDEEEEMAGNEEIYDKFVSTAKRNYNQIKKQNVQFLLSLSVFRTIYTFLSTI